MSIQVNNIVIISSIIFVFCGCSKTSLQEKENFSLYGNVTSYSTGKPLINIPIIIKASTAGTPGLFGQSPVTYVVGSANTDNMGYFKITPIKQTGIVYYALILDDSLMDISFVPGISADSIHKSLLTGYDMSFTVNNYGYLKVYFTDSTMPDVSDNVSIDVICSGNKSGPGFNVIAGDCLPRPAPNNLDLFNGNIQNGYAYYRVLGDATNMVYYIKGSKFFTDTQHYASIFCKANDTTYYNIKY